jgi:hypothetical protein
MNVSRISVIAALVALGWPTTAVSAATRVELRVYPRAVDIAGAPRLVLVNNAPRSGVRDRPTGPAES